MATAGQISARQQIAAKAIAERLTELYPDVEPINIPTRSRYGSEMLITLQLEAIASFLANVETKIEVTGSGEQISVVSLDYTKFGAKTLENIATDLGVNVEGTGANGRVLKSDYVKALEHANANG